MVEDLNLNELEKKAWKSTFQDGLWDIFFGLIFIGMGIYQIPRFYGLDDTFTLIMILMSWNFSLVLLFIIGKKFVTMPRMGFVKYGKERVVKRVKLAIFLGFMVLVNVIFLFLPSTGLDISLNAFTTMLIIGTLFITFPLCVMAYFLQFERLYIIAIMGGLGLSIGELLRPTVGSPLHHIIIFSVIGGIITTWGIVIFIRFLKEYPSPKKVQS
ncbi:MAG: hypothetical protein ACFFDB_01015 [Promethearchaeota archaeon]